MINYAGIGSRKTPQYIIEEIVKLSRELSKRNFTLRSGGARGADSAFELYAKNKKIYLPYNGFNNKFKSESNLLIDDLSSKNKGLILKIAKDYHPNWAKLNDYGEKFMMRNVLQVLGEEVNNPSDFVVFWSKKVYYDNKNIIKNASGGTGFAIRLAYALNIPVFHIETTEVEEILNYIDRTVFSSQKEILLNNLKTEISKYQDKTPYIGKWKRT